MKEDKKIVINTVYQTVSGEAGVFPQGTWCTIIRLQGCNLRCSYCDTPQGQSCVGDVVSISDLVSHIKTRHVMITGGEPLFQSEALAELVSLLEQRFCVVQIETNGSLVPGEAFERLPSRLRWVVDYKTPSSGEVDKMPDPETFAEIWRGKGVIKFVISDSKDLVFSLGKMQELRKVHNFTFILSPVDARGDMIETIVKEIQQDSCWRWLLDEGIVFSLQLHKIVNMQ